MGVVHSESRVEGPQLGANREESTGGGETTDTQRLFRGVHNTEVSVSAGMRQSRSRENTAAEPQPREHCGRAAASFILRRSRSRESTAAEPQLPSYCD